MASTVCSNNIAAAAAAGAAVCSRYSAVGFSSIVVLPSSIFGGQPKRHRLIITSFFCFQVKIWFQNRRSKYKKLMKTGSGPGPGGILPGGAATGQPLPGSSPPPCSGGGGGSPMMSAHTPNSQSGQMSPPTSTSHNPQPNNHSPNGGGGGTPQHQQTHHSGMPPYHASVPQPTPSPAGGDMSPGVPHAPMPSGSPPASGSGMWPLPPPPHHHGGGQHLGGLGHHQGHLHPHHQGHPQDIKPLPMHSAGQQMPPFQQYSWYQTQAAAASDNNMNSGLLT